MVTLDQLERRIAKLEEAFGQIPARWGNGGQTIGDLPMGHFDYGVGPYGHSLLFGFRNWLSYVNRLGREIRISDIGGLPDFKMIVDGVFNGGAFWRKCGENYVLDGWPCLSMFDVDPAKEPASGEDRWGFVLEFLPGDYFGY